ncbi:MAG TPA: TolC family protein [Nitrospiria bacterium]|nr:TolC family protein [Nitrospiria bacterium]
MAKQLLFGLIIFIPFIFWSVPALGEEPKGKNYTLQETLVIAEEKNPSMAVFRANLESAQGALISARAYANPELEVEFGRGRAAGEGGSAYVPEHSLGLSQSIEWPGKRLYRRKTAETELGVSREEMEDFRLELISQVKDAFFNLLLTERILEVSIKNRGTIKALVSSVRLRVDLGEAPELELIKAEVEFLKGTKDLKKAENRVAIVKAVLNSLLGGALGEDYEIQGEFLAPEKHLEFAMLVDTALTRHPLILRQKKALEAADYALLRERQARVPDLILKGSISDETDKRSYAVGLSVSFPIFYQNQGEIKVADAGKTRAQAELERTRLELTKLIIQEYQNYQIAISQLDVFDKGLIKQADEALRIARFSYEQGESGLLDLLDAQRVQRSTLSEYYEAQFELQAALARLERVTGGLP